MSKISALRKLIRTLTEIKNNLSYEYEEDYSKIYNACVDVDNNYNGIYLTDHIMEQNFVNDDDMEYLIKQNSDSIDRLRCFIGDTYSSDLYRIDGYGNLANVEQSDLEDLCDELIDMAKDYIEEERDCEDEL